MWKVDDGDRGLCVTLYKHERMSAYQVDMLAACRIEGLLLPTVQYRDQRVMLLYRKGAATSLARMAASGPAPDYAGYSRKALALLLECSRYLIYGGSVALDPELLFVGEGGTVSLPFMPFNLFGSALRGAAHYFAGCEALSLSHGGPHGLMAGMRALAEGMVASSAEGQLFLASQARFLKELDMALEAGRVAVGKDPTGEAGAVGAKGHGPAAAGGADAGSGAGSDAGSVRMGGERRQGRTGGAGPIGMVIEAIKRAIARFGHPRGDGRRAGRAGARRKTLGKERMASGIGGASLSMGGMLPSLKQLRPIADARQALWYGPASAGIDPELKGAWDERRQGWARCDAVGESVFNGLCGDYGDRVAMVGDTKADGLPPGPAGRVDAAATARADGF
ncbi:MAG: DUF6382 domain-containing protein, partial [Oscillospiraceae bacterium]|nr:DUF6382 domain-containing protein [Oscillospiraceae bacterium]